jgi:hypothetical protein
MRVAAAVVVAVAVLGPNAAFAQAEEPRFLISASAGFQPGDQAVADDGTFPLYDETGRLSVASDVAIGAFWDLSVAVRVTRGFTVGVGAHRGSGTDPIEVSGLAPHPVFFNRPRPFAATVDEAERIEKAFHLSAGYLVPLGTKFDVHVFAGPSKFRFEQDVVDSVTVSDTGGTFSATPNVVTRKKSTWGGHFGADVSYPIYQSLATSVRLGAFLRYAKASSEMPVVSNTIDTDVGGVQYGGGIRFRF